MKKIDELKNISDEKSKEMYEESLAILRQIRHDSKNRLEKMKNDPIIKKSREEYELRKTNGEFND